MQPDFAAAPGINPIEPSYLQQVRGAIQTRVIWLGREIKAIYAVTAPEVVRLLRKLYEDAPKLVILFLIPFEYRILCYATIGVTAFVALLADRIEWAKAKVFRPYLLGVMLDLSYAALLVYKEDPFPLDLVMGTYVMAYTCALGLVAAHLDEMIPQ